MPRPWTLALALATPMASRAHAALPAATYQGQVAITRAAGRIDRLGGRGASLTVRGWIVTPHPTSNGIDPATQPLELTIGDDSWLLEAGAMAPRHRGRAWAYRARAPAGGPRIVRVRIGRRGDGTFAVSLAVRGVDAHRLQTEDPICLPFGLLIGDDDVFDGIELTSPSWSSPRIRVTGRCDPNGHGAHSH